MYYSDVIPGSNGPLERQGLLLNPFFSDGDGWIL